MDKLDKIFEMQTALGNNVFKKQCINQTMQNLYFEGISDKTDEKKLGANSNVNIWLRRFLEAEKDETRELEEELLWKWWSKDTLDMQNIRVEIIDKLHFLISMAITAGLTSDDVFSIYKQKNKINLERQKNDYSKQSKNEDDCRGIE